VKILCDTDTLFHNIDGDDKKSLQEREALEELLRLRESRKILMFRSRVNRAELEATKNPIKKDKLRADYEALDQIPIDENPIGSFNITDHIGGCISNPIVSDILDENLYGEIIRDCLGKKNHKDAHHITHAYCNDCNVFLTRDKRIIKRRQWLEKRLPGLKIQRPSELLAELSGAARTT
jgi:hypothetical protein